MTFLPASGRDGRLHLIRSWASLGIYTPRLEEDVLLLLYPCWILVVVKILRLPIRGGICMAGIPVYWIMTQLLNIHCPWLVSLHLTMITVAKGGIVFLNLGFFLQINVSGPLVRCQGIVNRGTAPLCRFPICHVPV